MTTYTIDSTNDDYVTITVKFSEYAFTQTIVKQDNKAKYQQYADDYEKEFLAAQQSQND